MISITKLYCGGAGSGDSIRYGEDSKVEPAIAPMDGLAHAASAPLTTSRRQPSSIRPGAAPKSAAERRPVVVWNCTRTCNLKCLHCYTDSCGQHYEGELTGEEARALFDDLAAFEVPALLLSGGEPLMRPDLFALAEDAVARGLRLTLSTNGTLITPEIARRLKNLGFSYVGISLDGVGAVNDRFRGMEGAFERTMQGFRNCVEIGQRVGLRMTLTRHNFEDLENIFDFIERERIDRACFYHLAYSGRGGALAGQDLKPEESRRAMDIILRRTRDFLARGLEKDILTVGNHVDGVYTLMKLREEGSERAAEVERHLRWNGGGLYSSGVGIGDVDFKGDVHPDQFWMHYTLGSVRQRPFSEIWMDVSNPLMKGLKNRRSHIKGKCARCRWFDHCGGALRVRADVACGDPWEWDPGCYLTDEEIGIM
ncbi:MAG: radical SAM protein [Candidatus Sumerlaeota bacterium]|nr:radical SAM protein [Candidatus Sumerlaeota bacterium]